MDSKTAGLTDLVAGTAKVSDCIRAVPGGIHVLFAGSTVPPDPAQDPVLGAVLEDAGKGVPPPTTRVVIDSAPVELVSDARILATKATGVVYVIKADDTSHQAVRQGLGALSETGAPLLGVVSEPDRSKAGAGLRQLQVWLFPLRSLWSVQLWPGPPIRRGRFICSHPQGGLAQV